jgi:hypothetical protein
MADPRCPVCGGPIAVTEQLLGGYIAGRCLKDGRVRLPVPPTTADPMSRAAALSMTGVAGAIRLRVAEYIGERGPVAAWMVEAGLALEGNTVRPRIWELRKAGLVEERGIGTTPSNRTCHLYSLTDAGRVAIGAASRAEQPVPAQPEGSPPPLSPVRVPPERGRGSLQ